MDGDATTPYAAVATAELDDLARDLVHRQRLQVRLISTTRAGSMRIEGPCPRCGHAFSQTQVLRLPVTTVRGRDAPTPRDARQADFLCDCSVVHPDTPAGASGCGATYTVVAEGDARG